jgi:hypothetical protein
MSFLFLANHVGDQATAITATTTTTATGFHLNDVINGPRSSRWRSNVDTGSTTFLIYQLGADFTPDYCVISRADWLLTVGGKKLNIVDRNSGGSVFNISPSYNPVTSSDMLGLRSQDMVIPFTATHTRGYGIRTQNNGGNEATQISKLYFSQSLNIGAPQIGAEWEPVPYEQRMFTPPKGNFPYEVSAKMTLTFRHLSSTDIQNFKALPQILNWPFFLYDSAGDVWPHKLEHVVTEDWQEIRQGPGVWELILSIRRLKQYD